MSMPKIATRLNHVAYPTFDTAATVRFYTEVMGFKLVDAVHDESGPRPFLHTFFAMESGEIIAFFDIPGLEKPQARWSAAMGAPSGAQRRFAGDAWRRGGNVWKSHGIHVNGPVDHDGVWSSIYFMDPNAVTLELTYQARPLNDGDAERAARMVAEWTKAAASLPTDA